MWHCKPSMLHKSLQTCALYPLASHVAKSQQNLSKASMPPRAQRLSLCWQLLDGDASPRQICWWSGDKLLMADAAPLLCTVLGPGVAAVLHLVVMTHDYQLQYYLETMVKLLSFSRRHVILVEVTRGSCLRLVRRSKC